MKKLVLFLILTTIFLSPSALNNVQAQNPPPVFDITFLTPNTNLVRIQWADLIEQEIAKIGINVTHEEIVGWGEIAPRTWSYPFISYSYIPTYAQGGFDVLFLGIVSNYLDLNLAYYEFDTASIPPSGDNFYQFSNSTYDLIYNQYINIVNSSESKTYSHQLQSILYENLPAIGIICPLELYGFKEGLTGINPDLLVRYSHRPENWDDPDDHIIKYAVPTILNSPNIFKASENIDHLWGSCVYSGLFERNSVTHDLEPVIAKNVTYTSIVSDKFNVSVFLDPNAKFSDGSTVLPEDVKYSYQFYMSPAVASEQYVTLTSVFDDNDSIEIINNVPGGEMKFCFSQVDNFPLNVLSLGIVDKSEVEPIIASHGYDIFDELPGTGDVGWSLVKSCGPFKIYDSGTPSEGFDTINSIVHMIPNPHWHGSAPSLTDLYISFVGGTSAAIAELSAGNIDIMDWGYFPALADFEGIAGVEGKTANRGIHQELAINMKHPILGTGELTPNGTAESARKIRQAISHSIPRQTIVDDIMLGLGVPASLPLSCACTGFDDSLPVYTYDINLARTLIEQAGYVLIIIDEYQNYNVVLIMLIGLASIYTLRRKKK